MFSIRIEAVMSVGARHLSPRASITRANVLWRVRRSPFAGQLPIPSRLIDSSRSDSPSGDAKAASTPGMDAPHNDERRLGINKHR